MAGRDAAQRLGEALGWFSLGIGLPPVLAPAAMNRFIGLESTDEATAVMRSVGVQELVVGAAIIRSDKPARWLWSRVTGDLFHLALLRSTLASRGDDRRVRGAALAVAAIAVLDLIAAVRSSTSGTTGPLRTVSTVTVNRPAQEVYRSWRDLQQLPEFMAHLESVEPTDGNRWHWVARAPGGKQVEWDAEITDDRPDRFLAWRSVNGRVPNTGSVHFEPAPGDRGTEVTVEITYTPPGGRAAALAASLLGEAPEQQARDDLRRFKQIVETGQVVRSDAIPEGYLSRRQLKQQTARPSA